MARRRGADTRPTVGSLFSGYGGLDLAVEAAFGARTVWHVENDPHASKVLAAHWPTIPNHGNITAVDWAQVEPIDVLCGGFPCQDISSAGLGAGIIEGTRSGLWFRYADAIRVLRPRLVVVENVGMLLRRGMGVVLGDLADLGYDARWASVRASDVGAPHRRQRVFIVAHPREPGPQGAQLALTGGGQGTTGRGRPTADTDGARLGQHPGGPPSQEAGQERRDLIADPRRERSDPERRPATPHAHRRRLQIRSQLDSEPPRGATDGGACGRHSDRHRLEARWGRYASAIARWETVTGRPAPEPTDGKGRLSAPFVEWMMGLPAGWVTDVVGRHPALRCLGNGVVPQQAEYAIKSLCLGV